MPDHDLPQDLDAVLAFYAERDEATRLDAREAWVEGVRVRRLLADVLPPAPARILDVGGGPGFHAAWLTEAGHDVTVVDVVEDHVIRAAARGLDAGHGDARRLPFDDASADMVLLMGPLYHLVDAADRRAALREARRTLRPDGLLAVTAVTRLAVALDQLRVGALDDPAVRGVVARVVEHGHDPHDDAPVFHCHRVDELRQELVDGGFAVTSVHGVEGPAWPLLRDDARPGHPLLHHVTRIAELADGDPSVLGASAHLLAIARPVVTAPGRSEAAHAPESDAEALVGGASARHPRPSG